MVFTGFMLDTMIRINTNITIVEIVDTSLIGNNASKLNCSNQNNNTNCLTDDLHQGESNTSNKERIYFSPTTIFIKSIGVNANALDIINRPFQQYILINICTYICRWNIIKINLNGMSTNKVWCWVHSIGSIGWHRFLVEFWLGDLKRNEFLERWRSLVAV